MTCTGLTISGSMLLGCLASVLPTGTLSDSSLRRLDSGMDMSAAACPKLSAAGLLVGLTAGACGLGPALRTNPGADRLHAAKVTDAGIMTYRNARNQQQQSQFQ